MQITLFPNDAGLGKDSPTGKCVDSYVHASHIWHLSLGFVVGGADERGRDASEGSMGAQIGKNTVYVFFIFS